MHTLAGCPEVPDLAHRTSYVEFAGLKASVTRFDHEWVVRTAPAGTGPDDTPSRCLPGDLGERLYVLRVHGSRRDQDVIVRYAGCDHNGTDDGTTRRQLTADVVGPLLTGSDRAGVVLTDRIGRWLR